MNKETKLKASIYNEEKETPKFSPRQLIGLQRGLVVIRSSNIKNAAQNGQPQRLVCDLPAKVDYWLNKNETAIAAELSRAFKEQEALTDKYVLQKTILDTVFIVYHGADETDVVLQDRRNTVVREVEKDGKVELEIVNPEVVDNMRGYYYSEIVEPEIPAVDAIGVEGEEGYVPAIPAKDAIVIKHLYKKQFLTEDAGDKYEQEATEVENEAKYSLNLYKLNADNLEGLHIAWPNPSDPRNNLDEFRAVLFQHAITE